MKPHETRQLFLLPVFFIAFAALVSGCAEVAPPPGGPVDKTAPQLVSTTPVNGSVNVTTDNKIAIVFSERIVQPSTGRTVFISPRPLVEPDIDWKADRVEITLEEGFAPNQTYLVSVASTVADLRGNKLDSTITIAFSTGTTLDSGRIAGKVIQSNGSGARNTYVALYDSTALSDTITYDSIYPAYLTLTNEAGEFSLQYLPPQRYRLIAFQDKNRDERFNPRREAFAVPDRPIEVGGELLLSDLVLPLTLTDTTMPSIISASVTPNNLVRLRLGRSIPLTLLAAQPTNARLISVDDSLRFLVADGVAESHLDETDGLQVSFDDLRDGIYDMEITYAVDQPPLTTDSLEVEVREDDVPPAIEQFTPSDQPQFLRDIDIALAFSEPMNGDSLNEETFLLLQDSVTSVPLAWQWRDPFHLHLVAQLQTGAQYTLDIAEFDLLDRAGNALGDSITQYRFATLDTDSLGSIGGTVVVLVPGQGEGEVLLTFKKVGSRQEYALPVSGRDFRIDVPAGKYLIEGFIDQNGNGERDDGSIRPFAFSESRTALADTVAVRARFETAGIEFIFK